MDKEQSEILTVAPNKTTIKISKEVRDKLAEIGNKDETFEEVISRLIRRAESERSSEVVTSNSSVIQYKRRKDFVSIRVHIGPGAMDIDHSPKMVGIEYEYNVPPKQEGDWELDIMILKVYYGQKSYNPSEFFGVDNDHKYFSAEFIYVYFSVLSEVLSKDFGITKLINLTSCMGNQELYKWRKIYYENNLSQESFINDVEDVLRSYSEKKPDSKTQKQIGSSIAGH